MFNAVIGFLAVVVILGYELSMKKLTIQRNKNA